MKVFIELNFKKTPSQADVENYLHELMFNKCLDWHTDAEEYYYVEQIKEGQNKFDND